MLGRREVEVAGRAAEVQDGAAGTREGIEGGGQGCAELLWVVPRVVLCDHLLWAEAGMGLASCSGTLPMAVPHLYPRMGRKLH